MQPDGQQVVAPAAGHLGNMHVDRHRCNEVRFETPARNDMAPLLADDDPIKNKAMKKTSAEKLFEIRIVDDDEGNFEIEKLSGMESHFIHVVDADLPRICGAK